METNDTPTPRSRVRAVARAAEEHLDLASWARVYVALARTIDARQQAARREAA